MKTSLAAADKALWVLVVSMAVLAVGCSDRRTGDPGGGAELPARLSNAGQMGDSPVPLQPSGAGDLASAGLLAPVKEQEPVPSSEASPSSTESREKPAAVGPAAADDNRTDRSDVGVSPLAKKGEKARAPAVDRQPVAEPTRALAEEPRPQPVDLGPPLVEQPQELIKADPVHPVWLDPKNKRVVILGRTCKPSYLLEYFVSLPEKSYESVVEAEIKAWVVHAALLAFGVEPGQPVKWHPEYTPPSGPKIEIEVRWKDKSSEVRSARAQDWIRNLNTKQPLQEDFVFTGSGFWTDEANGRRFYQADGGDFVSVLNLPSAMIDLPIRSPSEPESRIFEANASRMPPPGTPVTMLISAKKP